jgi:ABC-type Zn2+ transport system substrate-binding protein/surface adhesin
MNKQDLTNIGKIFTEKMYLRKKKLSKKLTVNDDDVDEDDENEDDNNNDDEDDDNEDEDVQEDDEHTDIHLILPKCATMGNKKRSIIVSSTEEPIRKSSRNRKMNSFLTDFSVNYR